MAYHARQGDIIKVDFNPVKGHEQGNFRLALVISNSIFNENAGGMTFVLPITNSDKGFPLHIPLDNRTKTTGVILCEHVKSIDVAARRAKFVEQLPDDLLDEAISIVHGSIER